MILRTLLMLSFILFSSNVFAEKICVTKRPKVNKANRINLERAMTIKDDCGGRQFELEVPFKSTLPSGKTLTGFYAIEGEAQDADENMGTEISFPLALETVPSVEVLEVGEPATANCPGSASNPEAAPGFLCVYEGYNAASVNFPFTTNRKSGSTFVRDFRKTFFLVGTNASTIYGAKIRVLSMNAGLLISSGTWAVTAN